MRKNLFLLSLLICSLLLFMVACSNNQENNTNSPDNSQSENLASNEASIDCEGKCGEKAEWALNRDGVLTINGDGDLPNYSYNFITTEAVKAPWDDNKSKIKKVIIGEGIKSIGDFSFYFCSNLTDVSLPRGIVKIGTYAFASTGIEMIHLPYTLTTIGEAAFSTNSLKEVNLPYNVSELGRNAFLSRNLTSYTVAENSNYFSAKDGVLYNYLGTKLIAYPAAKDATIYTMPEEVTSIAFNAFFECNKLTSIVVSPNLREVEAGAFRACRNITSLSIPDGVQELGSSTFDGCTNLSSINIGAGVLYLSGTTFGSCNLTEVNVSPDNPYYTSINGVIFSKNGKTIIYYPCGRTIDKYNIPDGVTKIGPGCFISADYLTTINIPESVIEIGYSAFEWTNIESIYIPKSIKNIGFSAFSECRKLTTVDYGGSASDWIEIEIGNWNSILLKAERNYNKRKNIKIGVCPEYEPFEYIDSAGNMVGFDIDLAELICFYNDWNVTFVKVDDFSNLCLGLDKAEYDFIMSAMAFSVGRAEIYGYTNYYLYDYCEGDAEGFVAYTRKTDTELVKMLNDTIYAVKNSNDYSLLISKYEIDAIDDENIIKVGVSPDWEPFEYYNNEMNTIDGFEITLAKLYAAYNNCVALFIDIDFDSLLPGLDSGYFDIVMSGMDLTDARAEKYGHTDIYFHYNLGGYMEGIVGYTAKDNLELINKFNTAITAIKSTEEYELAKEKYGVNLDEWFID